MKEITPQISNIYEIKGKKYKCVGLYCRASVIVSVVLQHGEREHTIGIERFRELKPIHLGI